MTHHKYHLFKKLDIFYVIDSYTIYLYSYNLGNILVWVHFRWNGIVWSGANFVCGDEGLGLTSVDFKLSIQNHNK